MKKQVSIPRSRLNHDMNMPIGLILVYRSVHLDDHLDDPDVQCSYNHCGVLCGGCQHGLSLALGSTQCLRCSNNYLALLLSFALAGIVLVFFLKVLNLIISDGTLNGLILYANVVKANEYLFLLEKQMQVSLVYRARPSSRSRNFRTRIIKRGREA